MVLAGAARAALALVITHISGMWTAPLGTESLDHLLELPPGVS